MIKRRSCIQDAPVRESGAGAFPVSEVIRKCGALITALMLTAIVCAGGLTAGTESSYAADGSYTTKSFDVDVVISEKHVMQYEERIVVDFLEPHHGIYRYIPIQKKFYDIDGIHVWGGDYEDEYEYSGENENGTYGNQILRIGDPYNTYTGEKDYKIQYSLVCTKDEDKDQDWLSLDLIPTGWETPIDSSTVTLTLPKKVDWGNFKLYTGLAGEDENVLNDTGHFNVDFGADGKTLTIKARDLEQGYGVTLQASLPEGYWKGVTSRRWMSFLAVLIPALLALIMMLLWIFNGKDPTIVKPVEFYPPDDITPAEVGYIVDGRIDNKDMSSMIIYFASKGYLEIREKSKGSKKYELVKKCEIPDTEPVFAVRLFGGLFPNGGSERVIHKTAADGKTIEIETEPIEQKVDLDALPEGFSEAVSVAKDQLRGMYDNGKRKMFKDSSIQARNWGAFLCSLILPFAILITNFVNYRGFGLFAAALPFIMVLIGTALISSSYDNRHSSARVESVGKFMGGLAISVVAMLVTIGTCGAACSGHTMTGVLIGCAASVSLAAAIFFQVFMWARTEENAKMYGKVLGFRNFIATAEHDRLKALSDEDPEYFYNIMPYAMVMGMSVAWAKKFENLNIPKPEWYDGGASAADLGRAVWYSNIMNDCSRQFVSASSLIPDVKDAVDSGGFFTGGGGFSGGGFGGGGFSGGGFGGGGGGAW